MIQHPHPGTAPASLRHQRGNTLVGIIIGLVIGLGIAVVVALVISKGNTPFTDKASKVLKADTSAAADPNKPMYGAKPPARPAATAPAPAPAPAQAQAPAPAPAPAREGKPPVADTLQEMVDKLRAQPEPKPEARPAPRPSDSVVDIPNEETRAPLPEKAKAPVIAKADSADGGMVYYLQVGAFRETADAESARAKLALMGYEAAITERSTDTGVLHRVRMGPYNQVEAMNKVRTRLSENGIDVAVVRNQK